MIKMAQRQFLSVAVQVFGVHHHQIDDGYIDRQLAHLFKIDRDPLSGDGLHLPHTPVGLVGIYDMDTGAQNAHSAISPFNLLKL